MKPIRITTPLTETVRLALKAGDEVLLSGKLFTARDAAHQRFAALIKEARRIPLTLAGACIYYAGPTPARPGRPIGSCGPTTSSRMDAFTPDLLRLGVSAMIGKGSRSEKVRAEIRKHRAVYFLAIAGAGALLSMAITRAKPILFGELGPEAVYQLEVKDMPLIVGIDSKGNDIYATLKDPSPKRARD